MVSKFLKPVAVVAVSVVVLGFLLFGRGFSSYLRTGSREIQRAAQESVSVEFELQRARDMVDEILPQLQANVRLIAEDEVEIAALEKDIDKGRESLLLQQEKLAGLRDKMSVQQVSYEVGRRTMTRDMLKQELASQFDRYREAELILGGKEKLLETRRQSLANALKMHDRAKHQKLQLEQKIEALVAKHRLVQTSAMGSKAEIDQSQLSEADKLVAQIQRRLDISQRVLAHESDLQEIEIDNEGVEESELLAEFDQYFTPSSTELVSSEGSPESAETH